MTSREYRLSWESPSPWECDAYEQANGKDVWQRFDWDELRLTWSPTSVTWIEGGGGLDRMEQYRTLSEWAATRYQPIRNVRLEQRQVPDPTDGWTDVDPTTTVQNGRSGGDDAR